MVGKGVQRMGTFERVSCGGNATAPGIFCGGGHLRHETSGSAICLKFHPMKFPVNFRLMKLHRTVFFTVTRSRNFRVGDLPEASGVKLHEVSRKLQVDETSQELYF